MQDKNKIKFVILIVKYAKNDVYIYILNKIKYENMFSAFRITDQYSVPKQYVIVC